MYQVNDQIIKCEVDFLKEIIIVTLNNGKRYYKEFNTLENIKEQIQDIAAKGKKMKKE